MNNDTSKFYHWKPGTALGESRAEYSWVDALILALSEKNWRFFEVFPKWYPWCVLRSNIGTIGPIVLILER